MKKIVLLLLMATLIACSGETPNPGSVDAEPVVEPAEETEMADESNSDDAMAEEEMAEEVMTDDAEAEPAIATDYDGQGVITASGLQFIEVEEGTGAQPEVGSTVAVHYTGKLTDGTVFDSSVDRGQPIEFPLGQGRVIPGWDEGIGMMKEGGKAVLVIPPDLAYGDRDSGPIPANSTLIFDVELVAVQAAPPTPEPLSETADEYVGQGIITDSGLQFIETEEGTGAEAENGRLVAVHYTGKLTNGTVFDSSVDRGTPFEFALGRNRVIAGWDEGIAMMKEGGKATLVIPAALGYGDRGSPPTIPPGATLIFDVELVSVGDEVATSPEMFEDVEYTVTDSGLGYYDFEVGTDGTPEFGEIVMTHFTLWLEDGTKLDSSIDAGTPVPIPFGQNQLFPGWEEGLSTMEFGGKRQLSIPPELAFGEQGLQGMIPPNATLIMQVELVKPEIE